MSSEPSNPSSRSPQSPLPRGSACINCRRRKIRCDGVRPYCGHCSRTTRPQDCEYTDRPGITRTETLEEQFSRLQTRLRELEDPETGEGTIYLHHPDAIRRAGSPEISRNPSRQQSGMGAFGENNTIAGAQNWWAGDSPPVQIAELLVEIFLAHAEQLGFALNKAWFRDASGLPEGHPERPPIALFNTVFMWALRLSNMPHLAPVEPEYLNKALTGLPDALRSADSRVHLCAMQAEALLALYFFYQGRFLEGRYHADAAASVAISLRLHKAGSVPSPNAGPGLAGLLGGDYGIGTLMTSRNDVEEGERINLFWVVFNLDRCWSVALGSSPVILDGASSTSSIDAPWPMDMEEYERGNFQRDRFRNTVETYLSSISVVSTPNISRVELRAKASLLFERATRIAGSYVEGESRSNTFRAEFATLSRVIGEFVRQLVALNTWMDASDEKRRSYLTTFSLAQASVIQLNNIFADSDMQSHSACVNAALATTGVLERVTPEDLVYLDPIIGVAWVASSRIFANEAKVGRRSSGSSRTGNRDRALVQLNRLISVMEAWGRHCPLLADQAHSAKQLRDSL